MTTTQFTPFPNIQNVTKPVKKQDAGQEKDNQPELGTVKFKQPEVQLERIATKSIQSYGEGKGSTWDPVTKEKEGTPVRGNPTAEFWKDTGSKWKKMILQQPLNSPEPIRKSAPAEGTVTGK